VTENSSDEYRFGVGEESFLRIIQRNGVYVDKTELIHMLISNPWSSVPYFLSRPRRFGKTLLLDTVQKVFEGRRELFSGLAIDITSSVKCCNFGYRFRGEKSAQDPISGISSL
jgi:hypothetical protein